MEPYKCIHSARAASSDHGRHGRREDQRSGATAGDRQGIGHVQARRMDRSPRSCGAGARAPTGSRRLSRQARVEPYCPGGPARIHTSLLGPDTLLTGDDTPMNGLLAEILVSVTLLHGSTVWRRGVEGIGGRPVPDPRTVTVPFKANQDRRHHIPKQRHRVTNWAAYDIALRQRGSLTVWFTEAAIAAWQAEPRATRGGQPRYSALAITTALTLRAVFRLALRQTEGLIASILRLLGLDLAAPDHSTHQPTGRDIAGVATTTGQRTGTSAGRQHRAQALRSR